MRTGKSTAGRRLAGWLLAAAAVSGMIVSVMYSAMRGQAAEVCAYKARQAVNEIIAEEIEDCMRGSGGYVDITYRSDGSVGAVTADQAGINALENRLRRGINSRLSSLEDIDIGVKVGTLTGTALLNERGFELRMMMQLDGSADIKLEGALETAGINQTRHTLRLAVGCGVTVQLPGYSETVEAGGEYVISETVIVGDVPSEYKQRSAV